MNTVTHIKQKRENTPKKAVGLTKELSRQKAETVASFSHVW